MGKGWLVFRGAGLLGFLVYLVFSTPVPAAAGGVYFVKSGDTLAGISRLFSVDIDRVRELNRLDTAEIKPGARIRIPDVAPQPNPVAAVTKLRQADSDQVPLTLPAKPDLLVEVAQRREVSSKRVLQALCRDETVYHTIVKGDTLYSIAIRYATDLQNLLQLNELQKSARLSIGQMIVVRKNGPRAHAVRRGETLSRIAARYGLDVDALRLLNHLDGDKIAAGQQLLIEPCDPYAAAGGAPPSLSGPDSAGRQSGGLRSTTADSADTISRRVIKLARTMLNIPYRFGGSTLRGLDCSAYVQRVFRLIDLQIPRTAREQYTVGARIGRGDVQIGDLVFFRTYAAFPSHVGIYLGDNLFIHASSMVRKVTIDSMDQSYYRKRFIGARRLVVDNAPAVASTP